MRKKILPLIQQWGKYTNRVTNWLYVLLFCKTKSGYIKQIPDEQKSVDMFHTLSKC